jgi:hypothetical protein
MSEYAMARTRLGLYVIAQSQFSYAPFQQEGICLVLEQLMRGRFAKDGNKVAIHAPPRMGKSEVGSVHFPAWYLGHFPKHMVMVVSGSADLAIGFGRKTRNLIESPLHRDLFPKCQTEWDSRAKDDFSLTAGGHYWAMGFDGQITGKGAHLLIIDDPIKSTKDAESEPAEEARRSIFNSAIFPRLEPSGLLLLNMTKWPGDVFTPWLMEKFGAVPITKADLAAWRTV